MITGTALAIINKTNKTMANDYGVYKTLQDGTLSWVVTEMPLTFGDANNAVKFSYPDAASVSLYLTNTEGYECKVGRPNDRHPNA